MNLRPSRDPLLGASLRNTYHMPHTQSVSTPQGSVRTRPQDLINRMARQNWVQFGAEQVPAGAFQQNNVYADLRITGAGVDIVNGGITQLIVTATAPNPPNQLELLSGHFLHERWEMLPDGANTDDTIYPEQIFIRTYTPAGDEEAALKGTVQYVAAGQPTFDSTNVLFVQPESFDHTLDPNFPFDITRALALPHNSSRTYYFDLPIAIFNSHIFLPAVKQYMRIRQYFRQTPFVSGNPVTAGNFLTLSQNQLFLYGEVFSPTIRSKMMSAYSGRAFISRCLTHERQIFNVPNVVPDATSGDFSLTSYNGTFANLQLFLRASGATNENLYQWYPLNSITFENSSGNPVTINDNPGDFIRLVISARNYKSRFTLAYLPAANLVGASEYRKNLYEFPFSQNSEMTLRGVANTGFYPFSGNDTLRIKPGDSPLTGSPADLYTIAYRHSDFRVSAQGTASVQKH